MKKDSKPPSPALHPIGRRRALKTIVGVGGAALVSNTAIAQITGMRKPPVGTKPAPSGSASTAWDGWTEKIMDAVRQAVSDWSALFTVTGVLINGPIASGGRFSGPELKPLILSRLPASAVPSDVAGAFADKISVAWNEWVSSLKLPPLPLFPAFAAYPGPMTPPMPATPFPMAALSMNVSSLSSDRLENVLKLALGARLNEDGAADAISRFAKELSAKHGVFCAGSVVSNLVGKGPVPTFAPPYVPVGPVVAGDNVATTLVLGGAGFPTW